MRTRYLVCYDISDDKRLRRAFKTLRGFGDHVQYSVFRCDLTPTERALMLAALDCLIHHGEDQVLIVDLGPVGGRADTCTASLGRAYTCPERHAVVV